MEEIVGQVAGFMLMGGLVAFLIFLTWQFNRVMNGLERRSERKEQEKMHSDGQSSVGIPVD
jgi:flagellar biogenesis protein FliO